MNESFIKIKESIISGQPIIYLITYEETRTDLLINQVLKQFFKSIDILNWDINTGIIQRESNKIINDTTNPISAIDYLIKTEENTVLIMKDLNLLFNDNKLLRKLRQAYQILKNKKKFIFIISPVLDLPDVLKKEMDVIEILLPNFNELKSLVFKFIDNFNKRGIQVNLSEKEAEEFVIALQGLTYDEAHKTLMKALYSQKEINISLVKKIHEEKKHLILKSGVLEYITHKYSIDSLGGLDKLKEWLIKRKKAFSKEAENFGLEKPRGILTMGISGCGKSLASKIVATLWNLPLFRLDMNLVYSGISGSPEAVFSNALKTMDSVAPAVLWIDEIESGISDKQGDSASSRILGYFLTWMQEHKSEIFIAATANRIDLLPAELLRRGRFDQIFFIDLPTQKEREDIFKIHLQLRNNDLNDFNIQQLAQITKGWSGSEIEQGIISGMYEAFNENRKMNEDDLLIIVANTVPLSTTMEEQIKKIRSWAHNRAIRASSDKEY